MPSPGGGGHGGFGGGGFGGGGFHGGGFRGGRGPRMGGFWFFGPRFYYGGGCLGWFLGPIIALIVVAILMIAILVSLVGSIGKKTVAYSENRFESYLYDVYDEEFSGKAGYEDKIVLAVLTYDDHVEYRYMAMVGDHLPNSVFTKLRGDGNTALVHAMNNNMEGSSGYENKLARNLEGVVTDLTSSIGAVTFSCAETHVTGTSRLRNDSALSIDETMVNTALAAFTETTGVEMVIVVDEAAEVFGYQTPIPGIIALVILLTVAGVIIYIIVRNRKAKKNGNDGNNNGGNGTFNGNPRTDNNPYGNDNW